MIRTGNGPGVELFQYQAPDQDRDVPEELRLGRPPHRVLRPQHRQGRRVPAEQGRAEAVRPVRRHRRAPPPGQTINYVRTPFGTDIELISYPHGMAYQASAAVPLWDPRGNHP